MRLYEAISERREQVIMHTICTALIVETRNRDSTRSPLRNAVQ